MKAAAVLGNVNLDVICRPVDEVPRQDSILFEQGLALPGGCGSNTAIGLACHGIQTRLIALTGEDPTADLLFQHWSKAGVDVSLVARCPDQATGISVVLVDSDDQPRFVHTPGANTLLDESSLDTENLRQSGVAYLHVAGYFVLPGLLNDGFGAVLGEVKRAGINISLDVVTSPAMEEPAPLWNCLPALDVFLCNRKEAARLTGIQDPSRAAGWLQARGAGAVIIKLGAEGCLLVDREGERALPAPEVIDVVDTTGAGDAFAAGLVAALVAGCSLEEACLEGNRSGAEATRHLGAVKLPGTEPGGDSSGEHDVTRDGVG